LPAGKYQLQVIAGNNDNAWSEPGLSLQIVVKPAPWNTWWAYLLYAISIALALLAYSRFLNRKLIVEQEQKALLAQQVEDQTKEFQLKNIELEHANKQLENAATVDKLTGVKSRRYLDIYIEQASQLMTQIHQNILPVQRSILPRLYILMVQVDDADKVSNSQLLNLTDLLLYSRNSDDLVIRWSEDTFSIIGYEKEDNARELSIRLSHRFCHAFGDATKVNMAYSFYPFNVEHPTELSWDQVSVITENALNIVSKDSTLQWLGLYNSFVQPFSYMDILHIKELDELSQVVSIKQG
jgi:GGDEF domain-containing protein